MRKHVVALLCLVMIGCSSGNDVPASTEHDRKTSIVVFAAASVTETFSSVRLDLPQVRPEFNFAGSQQLVTELTQGAAADVVATADEASMQRLVDAQLVEAPITFARNTLVIAVPPGNPKGIGGLADLARPGLDVVLADPSVPAGRYAKQVLDGAGVKVSPRSLELDVKATLAKVTGGVADAAVVYLTDVRASAGKASAVTFPQATDPAVAVSYRIAVVSATRHRQASEAFVASAVGGSVHDALLVAGFAAA